MRLRFIGILLVCMILMLSVLDAPEYIRCVDIGLCEFLDLHAHMADILKPGIIKVLSLLKRDYSFITFEALLKRKEFIQDIIVSSISAILRFFDISYSLQKSTAIFPANIKREPPLVQHGMPAQILRIIEVSVILS